MPSGYLRVIVTEKNIIFRLFFAVFFLETSTMHEVEAHDGFVFTIADIAV